LSCNSEQKELAQMSSIDSVTIKSDTVIDSTIGKPYFDFDEVLHYSIDEKLIYEAEYNADAEYEKRLRNLLNGCRDGQITDTVFWADMESFKKNKNNIKAVYFNKLNSEVFVNRGCGELYGFGCIPIFRDILVFKKGGKVIGLAKICFQCERCHFEGNNSNTEWFGLNAEFETLKTLLKENSKL